jgi:hypothetical protein
MSQNTQNPYFFTLDESQNLQIDGATYISVYAETDVINLQNQITLQNILIPASCVMELSPDSGNTLQTLVINPQGLGIAYVTMLGGTAQFV